MNTAPEFIRNIPSITGGEQAALAGKRVLIAGCGGLGGYLLEFSVRLGIGHIRLVDGDVFDRSNRNRQLLSLADNLDQSKAHAARQRALEILPQLDVEAAGEYITRENASRLVRGCDAVLDGLDNIPSRRILWEAAREAGIPYVYGAVQGFTAQAALFWKEDSWLELLYPTDHVPENKSTLSFTPALCACIQCSLCLDLLTGRRPETGILHHADLQTLQFQQIPLIG